MYCDFGVSSCLTNSRLGALVEVDGMLFSGRLRVGIAPGTSLLQVGKYNQNWLIMVIFEVSFVNMDGFPLPRGAPTLREFASINRRLLLEYEKCLYSCASCLFRNRKLSNWLLAFQRSCLKHLFLQIKF